MIFLGVKLFLSGTAGAWRSLCVLCAETVGLHLYRMVTSFRDLRTEAFPDLSQIFLEFPQRDL